MKVVVKVGVCEFLYTQQPRNEKDFLFGIGYKERKTTTKEPR